MGLKDIFGRPLPIGMRVDITSVIDVKTKMLAAHASQRQWLKKISRIDEYLSSMRDQSHKEGTAIGARYAEGFIQHAGLGHPQDNILTKLLGPLCVKAG
jgi:LmbE family N-acetylglucosaminyl deacetylase